MAGARKKRDGLRGDGDRPGSLPVSIETQPTAPVVPGTGRSRRRPEIDGLRALAVTLVVVYHVFTGRVSGGVDVFLALSGFFLVQSMISQIRRGRVRVLQAVARTV